MLLLEAERERLKKEAERVNNQEVEDGDILVECMKCGNSVNPFFKCLKHGCVFCRNCLTPKAEIMIGESVYCFKTIKLDNDIEAKVIIKEECVYEKYPKEYKYYIPKEEIEPTKWKN